MTSNEVEVFLVIGGLSETRHLTNLVWADGMAKSSPLPDGQKL
jgi:hypothetical protein